MNKEADAEKTYYLYRHIRDDKDEPFYIGKGIKNQRGKKEKTVYSRAFEKRAYMRNSIWNRIVDKTSYQIEIIFESFDENIIIEKEKEFISLYGKKIDLTGTLANITDGGEVGPYTPKTSLAIENWKNSMLGKPRDGKNSPLSKEIYVYKINGDFYKKYDSINECSRELNINDSALNKILKNKNNLRVAKGFTAFYEFQGDSIEPLSRYGHCIKIEYLDKNSNIIKTFMSITEASIELNMWRNKIKQLAENSLPDSMGNTFRYLKNE